MRNLTLQDFEGRAGTPYEVVFPDGTLPLTLRDVEPLRGAAREDAFRLVFVGPTTPIMPQSIYTIRRDDGDTAEIFFVPIGEVPDGIEYEAIFN